MNYQERHRSPNIQWTIVHPRNWVPYEGVPEWPKWLTLAYTDNMKIFHSYTCIGEQKYELYVHAASFWLLRTLNVDGSSIRQIFDMPGTGEEWYHGKTLIQAVFHIQEHLDIVLMEQIL